MKKMIVLAAAAAMAFAFASCDDNAEHCWEVTTTTSGTVIADGTVSYFMWGTKSDVKDYCDKAQASAFGVVKVETSYKKVADDKCEAEK